VSPGGRGLGTGQAGVKPLATMRGGVLKAAPVTAAVRNFAAMIRHAGGRMREPPEPLNRKR